MGLCPSTSECEFRFVRRVLRTSSTIMQFVVTVVPQNVRMSVVEFVGTRVVFVFINLVDATPCVLRDVPSSTHGRPCYYFQVVGEFARVPAPACSYLPFMATNVSLVGWLCAATHFSLLVFLPFFRWSFRPRKRERVSSCRAAHHSNLGVAGFLETWSGRERYIWFRYSDVSVDHALVFCPPLLLAVLDV